MASCQSPALLEDDSQSACNSTTELPALPPAHLDMDETVKPIEQHGFSIVDFTPDKMTVRLFKWDWKTQKVEDIDTLQPFHTLELTRPI